tara:strand:- start:840 stop:1019 length:180 start_codon:yes stop_codon:yes gene_type:complete
MKRKDLPNNIEELKDIVEMQLIEIKALKRQINRWENPYHITVTFGKDNKPLPPRSYNFG